MSPYPSLGQISFTKFTSPEQVTEVLKDVLPGTTTASEVQAALGAHGQAEPLFNDLLAYEPPLTKANDAAGQQVAVDNELLRASRDQRNDRLLLVWVALNLADPRLDTIVREVLTDATDRLIPEMVNSRKLGEALDQRSATDKELPQGAKVTSNILSLLERCLLIVPEKHSGSIVGIASTLPTRHAVPGAVTLIAERLSDRGLAPLPGRELELAISIGANAWLNLSPAEFRDAYVSTPTKAETQTARDEVPDDLAELASQLRRKGQVVLQGPPGSGKTYVARKYVGWATGDRAEDSRLQGILDSLPSNESSVIGIADEIERLGLAAVWDIVQFHPGYDYTDFVRALVAQPHGNGVTFAVQHRLLSLMAAVGVELERRGVDVELVLVLDEINRGDIPNIFGELLYGLEYRAEAVATPYSIDGDASLTIPASLRVIGTMNTADRSIAVIDYALRRRFVFLDVASGERPITSFAFDDPITADAALYLYRSTAVALAEAPAGLQVGPSYFLAKAEARHSGIEVLADRYIYEVLPLLDEYEMEGEIERGAVVSLCQSLGVDDAATQRERAQQLAAHLAAVPGTLPPTEDIDRSDDDEDADEINGDESVEGT